MDNVAMLFRNVNTIRAFASVPIPQSSETHEALTFARDQLRSLLENRFDIKAIWEDTSYHITLRFFGEVTYKQVRNIQLYEHTPSAPTQKQFDLALSHYDIFTEEGSSIIYLSVRGDVEELRIAALQANEAAKFAGLPPPEFPFHPHVTLCRIPPISPSDVEELGEQLWRLDDIPLIKWTVSHLDLMYSHRAKDMLGEVRMEYREITR